VLAYDDTPSTAPVFTAPSLEAVYVSGSSATTLTPTSPGVSRTARRYDASKIIGDDTYSNKSWSLKNGDYNDEKGRSARDTSLIRD